jgi:hypothetical protein
MAVVTWVRFDVAVATKSGGDVVVGITTTSMTMEVAGKVSLGRASTRDIRHADTTSVDVAAEVPLVALRPITRAAAEGGTEAGEVSKIPADAVAANARVARTSTKGRDMIIFAAIMFKRWRKVLLERRGGVSERRVVRSPVLRWELRGFRRLAPSKIFLRSLDRWLAVNGNEGYAEEKAGTTTRNGGVLFARRFPYGWTKKRRADQIK